MAAGKDKELPGPRTPVLRQSSKGTYRLNLSGSGNTATRQPCTGESPASGIRFRAANHVHASGGPSPETTPRVSSGSLLDGRLSVQSRDADNILTRQRPPSRQASLGRYKSAAASTSSTTSVAEPDELLRRLSAAHMSTLYPPSTSSPGGGDQAGGGNHSAADSSTVAVAEGPVPTRGMYERPTAQSQALPRRSPRASQPGSPPTPSPPPSSSLAPYPVQPAERGSRSLLQRVASTGRLAGSTEGTSPLSSPSAPRATQVPWQNEAQHHSMPVLASIQGRALQQTSSSSMRAGSLGSPMYRRSASGSVTPRDTSTTPTFGQQGGSLTLLVGSALATPGIVSGVKSPSTRRAALLAAGRQG
jgi:hypothetical protein